MNKPEINHAAMLHVPDVRLSDIETRVESGETTLTVDIAAPQRAMLVCPLKGSFLLEMADLSRAPQEIAEGAAVGLQTGLKHRWTGLNSNGGFELFVSSINRTAGLLQGLDHELIIVPADAYPSAAIIRHAVAIHLIEHQDRKIDGDDLIIRRCAEIVMAELVRFARTTVIGDGAVPHGIAHDEYLLRAWSAYFADPRARWTVQSLASAAGLSRTAFSERFRNAVGVPPLTALTDLRLQQALALLREGETSLIEIAFAVGYNSEAAFVRAFSRKYGLPPGRFRTQHLGGET